MLPPILFFPFAKSIKINSEELWEVKSICGVKAKLTSLSGAKAETIKDNGEITE